MRPKDQGWPLNTGPNQGFRLSVMLAGVNRFPEIGAMMDLFGEFPELGRGDLRDFKKAIDAGFRSFSRAYGDELEAFFDPYYNL